MAFLKDHKVENHLIFPAAGFVEMALEAGVQLFEGRPFVVEDFEIRKPLILPDPPSGLQLELSYSPNERTFAIQSRFEQSVTWSLHVVGSLRGERTESAFASSKWEQPHDAQSVAVDGFYRHMSDLGLPYGEEFRPIRELSAGGGQSAGPGGFVGCYRSARRRICPASSSLRRSAPGFLRRRGDGRRSPDANEIAGPVWPHSFPRLARRGEPRLRESLRVQRRLPRRRHRDLQ